MMTETVVTVQPTNGVHSAHQQQAPGDGLGWLQFNLQYFATIPGIIKLVQLELVNTGIAAVFYFIAFIVQLAAWSSIRSSFKGSNITAGVFGLFNFLAYLAGTYFLYIEHRSAST
uniref:CSON011303 protein n=1 Tax=Culicoides sonorensis TaxID=179676 RepID=A0A336K1N4_CULSO